MALLPWDAKPPWNQPHETFFSLRRSPTFLPCIAASASDLEWLPFEQSSKAGSGSSVTVPTPCAFGDLTAEGLGVVVCWPVNASMLVTPCVCPATRLSAPGVDGPKTSSKLLSLIAKCCAWFHMPVTVLPS